MHRSSPVAALARGSATHRIHSRTAGRRRHLDLEPLEQRLALTTLPAGFTETLITTQSNLASPTAMEISPTGEFWVLEQAGEVEFIRADGSSFTALDITVDSQGERGLLGIAFDPSYDGAGPNADYVYLYYTKPRTGQTDPANNQVVRYEIDGAGTDTPELVNEEMIRELPPEDEDNNLETNGDTNHNGGAIHFGPDGKLYVAIGDHNYDGAQATHPSQRTDTPFGKMLRLNPDGSNPDDNPFYNGSATNWEGSIWAMGLRNPFTFAIDPADGRVFINDVGEGSWEEINAGEAGANFGWAGSSSPLWEGFENDATPPPWTNYDDPQMAYNHSSDPPTPAAVNITGGVFYPGGGNFGEAYEGMYFFSDAGANFIRFFDPANPGSLATPDTSQGFASNMSTFGPVDLKVDAQGNLYYLARGGELYRITGPETTEPAEVVGRHVFYNNSKFDGNDAAANAADDAAIAPDKSAYLAGSGVTASQHLTSYTGGINGIMIDLAGDHGTLTADDFSFRVGKNNSPEDWALAPAPTEIVVRAGEGAEGSDRITLTWADGAIVNQWLQVIVEGNDSAGGGNTNTGLAASDVFYFGSRVGDDFLGTPPATFVTNASDEIGARLNPGFDIEITSIHDFNRDQVINATDQIAARMNTGFLFKLNLPGPAVATSASGDASALASALAGRGRQESESVAPVSHARSVIEAHGHASVTAAARLAEIEARLEAWIDFGEAAEAELDVESLISGLLEV